MDNLSIVFFAFNSCAIPTAVFIIRSRTNPKFANAFTFLYRGLFGNSFCSALVTAEF